MVWALLEHNAPPGNSQQAEKYQNLRAQRMEAMQALMWDQQKGAWFDYDLDKKQKNPEFYPTNLAPLWAGCFQDSKVVDQALKYLEVRAAGQNPEQEPQPGWPFPPAQAH